MFLKKKIISISVLILLLQYLIHGMCYQKHIGLMNDKVFLGPSEYSWLCQNATVSSLLKSHNRKI